MASMNHVVLEYGAAEPLALEFAAGALMADCRGPEGLAGEAAKRLVAAALAAPPSGPPLQTHAVPGDRVAVAISGSLPQPEAVLAAVVEQLHAAGVSEDGITLLHAPTLWKSSVDGTDRPSKAASGACRGIVEFDPSDDAQTAYLAADEDARPLYLARTLVDADVVVTVGAWRFDASLGGRSLEGEIWPTFARSACRQDLFRSLAKKGRHALAGWRTNMQEIAWQLGVCASLRLVAGRGDSLAAASFGLPDAAARLARGQAAAWSPEVPAPAAVTIGSLADSNGGFTGIARAVAAAARVTQPGGTICIASTVADPPGPILTRWRQGAPLEALVHEAISTDDPSLVADAMEARLFARALDDRRLVLLSALDESTVEDLEFGFAEKPAIVERLARRAESLIVLHEADRMFPLVLPR